MELDLRDWMDRYAEINGCYYEVESTALLQSILLPGAAFVDVGGNVGFLSLTAAALVGPRGKVIYIEPNQALVARFRLTLARNQINNVEVHAVALADSSGEVALQTGHSHGVTQVVPGIGTITRSGDELLGSSLGASPALVKIDIEGFEQRALAGMAATIERRNTAFYIEVTDSWLRENGGSAAGLFGAMGSAGYDAWHCYQTPFGMRLDLVHGALGLTQANILFARPGDFGAP